MLPAISPRAADRLRVAAALLLAAIVLAHAALLPAAQWQADEYLVLHTLDLGGWRTVWQRIVDWSPRPLAETLYYGYAEAVRWTGQPLLVPLLGLWWLALGLAGSLWWRGAGTGLRSRQLVTVALFAAFLLGHGVSEVFYWPAGATAYLVALAALTLLFTALLRGRAAGDWVPAAALLVLAGSCEIGAMFALGFGVLAVPLGERRAGAWLRWAVPVVVSCGVLAMLARGRVGAPEIMVPGAASVHHGLASLRAAVRPFVDGLLGATEGAPPRLRQVAARLLLLFGLRACLAGAALPPLPVRPLAAFVLAALAAAGVSIAAAYYQFGTLCCQRHDTLRQCLYVLALASVAALSLRLVPARRVLIPAPLLLLLAFVPASLPRLAELRHDLPLVPAAAAARAATWRSGRAPGAEMAFQLPPSLLLINPPFLTPGRYELADPRWYATSALLYFGKHAMDVLPPR